LGHTFNPLSVYFCKDAAGAVSVLIYQVHNTFGQSHCYVEPVRAGQTSPAGIRQSCDKKLYVSPFMEMAMNYRFRIVPPEKTVALRILETNDAGPVLAATIHGRRKNANSRQMMHTVLQTLGITRKVTAGGHDEALRLWLEGLRPIDRPGPPQPESFPERLNAGKWTDPVRERA
jgi:DUF1365 family protein